MADLLDEILLPGASEVVDVCDPLELDSASSMTRRFARDMQMYRYVLLDRSLLHRRFDGPITRHATWDMGDVMVCRVADRFAIQLDIGDAGVDSFCFSRMLAGRLQASQDGVEAACGGASGLAFRPAGGSRVVTGDGSGRTNTWIGARFLEGTLEQLLGDRLRRPLRFRLDVDWSRGPAASVAGLLAYFEGEAGRPDGLLSNPVALRSMQDVLARGVLLGLPHNHSERLQSGGSAVVPAYVSRAEAFMGAHAADAIGIADIAAAAGCSVRTLQEAFRRFRDTTPLATLHAKRLDAVRAELQADATGASLAAVARRYGFTNRQRFRTAYQRRFGSPPPKRG